MNVYTAVIDNTPALEVHTSLSALCKQYDTQIKQTHVYKALKTGRAYATALPDSKLIAVYKCELIKVKRTRKGTKPKGSF